MFPFIRAARISKQSHSDRKTGHCLLYDASRMVCISKSENIVFRKYCRAEHSLYGKHESEREKILDESQKTNSREHTCPILNLHVRPRRSHCSCKSYVQRDHNP